jgi:uncharacterized protein with PhoU and TrkA domain
MFDFTLGGLVILVFSVVYTWLSSGGVFCRCASAIAPLSAATINAIMSMSEPCTGWRNASPTSYAARTTVRWLGKRSGESRIGHALGLNVLSIRRRDGSRLPAEVNTELEGGDRLLILGRLDRIEEFADHPIIAIEEDQPAPSRDCSLMTLVWRNSKSPSDSAFAGRSLASIHFRREYGLNVLAIRHGEVIRRTNLQNIALAPGDRLLLAGTACPFRCPCGPARLPSCSVKKKRRTINWTNAFSHPHPGGFVAGGAFAGGQSPRFGLRAGCPEH